jgi:hypothetical protein
MGVRKMRKIGSWMKIRDMIQRRKKHVAKQKKWQILGGKKELVR